jgi:hypothetical protein
VLPSTILMSGSCARPNLICSSLAPGKSCNKKAEARSSRQIGRAQFGMVHIAGRGRRAILRLRRPPAGGTGRAAERNDVGERLEAEEIGLVERTDARFPEPTINAQRHPADTERRPEPSDQTAACDQALNRSRLMLLQPCQYRKIVRWIECNQIDGLPFDQRGDDALRRHPGNSGNTGYLLREIGSQGLVGWLHGEQARSDIHERGTCDDDEVGAHAREAGRNALAQRPAGDEAGEADADAEHHGRAQKKRAQPPAPDVLRRQPNQQPTIMPAASRSKPHPVLKNVGTSADFSTRKAPRRGLPGNASIIVLLGSKGMGAFKELRALP